MSDPARPAIHTVTVLRGPAPASTATAPMPTIPPGPPDDALTVYGVPVSAIKHCCGRGCKHCRIYWYRAPPP